MVNGVSTVLEHLLQYPKVEGSSIEIRLECRCLQKSFHIKFGGFFYNKSKILTILFIVKYEKITLF